MASRRRDVAQFLLDLFNGRDIRSIEEKANFPDLAPIIITPPYTNIKVKRGVGFYSETNNKLEGFLRIGNEIPIYHTNAATEAVLDCSLIIYSYSNKPREALDLAIQNTEKVLELAIPHLHNRHILHLYVTDIKFLEGIDKDRGMVDIGLRLEYNLPY